MSNDDLDKSDKVNIIRQKLKKTIYPSIKSDMQIKESYINSLIEDIDNELLEIENYLKNK